MSLEALADVLRGASGLADALLVRSEALRLLEGANREQVKKLEALAAELAGVRGQLGALGEERKDLRRLVARLWERVEGKTLEELEEIPEALARAPEVLQ